MSKVVYKKLSKKAISNILLAIYGVMIFVTAIDKISMYSGVNKVSFTIGLFSGVLLSAGITLVYWYHIKARYVKDGNKVSLVKILIGFFLVALTLIGFGSDAAETFVVLSIAIILREDYKITLI